MEFSNSIEIQLESSKRHVPRSNEQNWYILTIEIESKFDWFWNRIPGPLYNQKVFCERKNMRFFKMSRFRIFSNNTGSSWYAWYSSWFFCFSFVWSWSWILLWSKAIAWDFECWQMCWEMSLGLLLWSMADKKQKRMLDWYPCAVSSGKISSFLNLSVHKNRVIF